MSTQCRSRGTIQCRSEAEDAACVRSASQEERTLVYYILQVGQDQRIHVYIVQVRSMLHSASQEQSIHDYIVQVRSRGYMTTQCRSGAEDTCLHSAGQEQRIHVYIVQDRSRGYMPTQCRSGAEDKCLHSAGPEQRMHDYIVQVRSRGYMTTQCRSDAEIHVCIVQQERTLIYIGRSGSEDTCLHSVGQEERIHVYIVQVRSRGCCMFTQ